jgi:hypothetical protein
MNVTDLANPAGAGATDRWVRSYDMNQLITRSNHDMLHFYSVGRLNVLRQFSRAHNVSGAFGKDRNAESRADTIIGVVYVGALILLMFSYLT